MTQLTHPYVRFYKPQQFVPVVGETTTLIAAEDFTFNKKEIPPAGTTWRTSTVVATFLIPGFGLGILTRDYLYLPDRRK